MDFRRGHGSGLAAPAHAIVAVSGYTPPPLGARYLRGLHFRHSADRPDGLSVCHRLGVDLLGNGHEPAVEQNNHPVLPSRTLHGVQAHKKVFGRHDAITQLLVDNHLHRPCIVTHDVMQPPGGRLVKNGRGGCIGPLGDDLHSRQQVRSQSGHSR